LNVCPFNKEYKDDGPTPAIAVATQAIAVTSLSIFYFMLFKKHASQFQIGIKFYHDLVLRIFGHHYTP
jgi:hypothetical protein